MSFLSEWTQWNELTIGSSTAKVAMYNIMQLS